MNASDRESLASVLLAKNLVVLVGEGGVGKTSTSAAIAYGRALGGEHVGVLTVDPAPRLGDALGLAAIDAEPRAVALPRHARGSLAAMRLDSKRTFDRMVERHSASPQAAESLLAHPLYQAVSGRLGGTENYMAFQRLHELVEMRAFHGLVIDTPPAANAAELLAAPARLASLLDTGALSILAEPARIVARAGGAIARAAFALILAALERVTGPALQSGIGEFVGLFGELLGGLEDRARAIDALLRAPGTAFVLVTRPREHDVERALAFRDDLARMGLRVDAVVVNRLTAPRRDTRPASKRLAKLPKNLHGAVKAMEAEMDALRAVEAAAMRRLHEGLEAPAAPEHGDEAPPVFTTRARDVDVSSLGDIAELAEELGY